MQEKNSFYLLETLMVGLGSAIMYTAYTFIEPQPKVKDHIPYKKTIPTKRIVKKPIKTKPGKIIPPKVLYSPSPVTIDDMVEQEKLTDVDLDMLKGGQIVTDEGSTMPYYPQKNKDYKQK